LAKPGLVKGAAFNLAITPVKQITMGLLCEGLWLRSWLDPLQITAYKRNRNSLTASNFQTAAPFSTSHGGRFKLEAQWKTPVPETIFFLVQSAARAEFIR
jgi:hypothetical protein